MTTVTLSFDNGPTPGVSERVLDILAEHAIAASFFPLGRKLGEPSGRAIVARAHAEGHWIGNHTFNHATPLGELAGDDVAEREIGRAQQALGRFVHPERFFRPFGGGGRIGPWLLSPACLDYLRQGGYSMVLWNAVPRDWEDPSGWVETALAQVEALEHALVVLHDLPAGAGDRLEQFLAMLNARGHRFSQDFPADCVPLRRGEALADLSGYVAAGRG